MTKDEILAEMARRPDAHALIEWISEYVEASGQPIARDIEQATAAYFDALEG